MIIRRVVYGTFRGECLLRLMPLADALFESA